MTLEAIYHRDVDLASPAESAWQAAVRMQQHGVGCLIVVNESRIPIGVVTDRDLMERIIAARRDPDETKVREVMTGDLVTIAADLPVDGALKLMKEGGFRRLPIVDGSGAIAGIVSTDDVLVAVADKMQLISQLMRSESPQGIAARSLEGRWE